MAVSKLSIELGNMAYSSENCDVDGLRLFSARIAAKAIAFCAFIHGWQKGLEPCAVLDEILGTYQERNMGPQPLDDVEVPF